MRPTTRLLLKAGAFLFLFLAPSFAAIALAQEETPITLNQVQNGSLLFKTTKPGLYLPAPAVDADVAIHVDGVIARAVVTQRFTNPNDVCVEGIYVFPLPEDAAVDSFRMVIGQRVIEGVIKEKAEAKKVYEEAKSEGRRASLIEQERPNLFTLSVANLGAHETIEIIIELQQTVRYDDGKFSLRFPTVAGPRYSPNTVADIDRVSPPYARPGSTKKQEIGFSVNLDTGFAVQELQSESHPIEVQTLAATRHQVTLPRVPSESDFLLTWTPRLDNVPQSAFFLESPRAKGATDHYAMLMLMPPAQTNGVRIPREVIFIIDTSGSMAGESIVQARNALRVALDRLQPADRFNIIEFDSSYTTLFESPRHADTRTVVEADAWVERLDADGGTEMRPALEAALKDSESPSGFVRQVIFITDGLVGNEDELFRYVKMHLGDSRLFTVGIGSAPNSHFMSGAAKYGRGTFTYISRPNEVERKMGELFRKLENPVLRDLAVTISDPTAEIWPARIPDLYHGEPIVLAMRLSKHPAEIRISGTSGHEAWSMAHTVGSPGSSKAGVSKLWARRKIESLLEQELEGRAEAAQEILNLALEHHLVSKYTSLVAVDLTPPEFAGQVCEAKRIPLNLPKGMEYEKIFGRLPQTATPAPLFLVIGLGLLATSLIVRWAFARS